MSSQIPGGGATRLPSPPPRPIRSHSETSVEGDRQERKSNRSDIRRVRSAAHIDEKPIGLIVEDEGISAKIELPILERAFGGKFDLATHFKDGINKLRSQFYEILATDHNLNSGDAAKEENKAVYLAEKDRLFPDGLPDGLAEGYVLNEFAKNLPSDRKPTRQILISAASGITESALRDSAHAQGTDFLPKPITLSSLRKLIASWNNNGTPTLTQPATPPGDVVSTTTTVIPGEPTLSTGSSVIGSLSQPSKTGIAEEGEEGDGDSKADKAPLTTPPSELGSTFSHMSLHDPSRHGPGDSGHGPGVQFQEHKVKEGAPKDGESDVSDAHSGGSQPPVGNTDRDESTRLDNDATKPKGEFTLQTASERA